MRLAATSCTLARNLPPVVVQSYILQYTIITVQTSTIYIQRSPRLGAIISGHEAGHKPDYMQLNIQESRTYIR